MIARGRCAAILALRRPAAIVYPAIVLLIGLAAVLTLPQGLPRHTAACDVPADLMDVDGRLPHLAEALRVSKPVTIIAIGGASTAGLAAGSVNFSYPYRLQQVLGGWYPKVPITVLNKSVPHQTAEQMVERFPADVIPYRPALVVWETGTTDAVSGADVDAFAATLQAGIDGLAARGIDVILVDMQFSHRTEAIIDFESYLRAMHRVGDVKDIFVFPRFAMMRYWSEQNVFNLDSPLKGGDRASLAARVYRCLGQQLAEAVRSASQ